MGFLSNPGLVGVKYRWKTVTTPIVLVGSGTWNDDNGSLTLTTALPAAPTGTGVLVFLANSGVANGAGLYSAVFQNTTNLQVSGTGGTTPGAYTAVTTPCVLAQYTLPANSLNPVNGKLEFFISGNHNNSAGTKTYDVTVGGTVITSAAPTTSQGIRIAGYFRNEGQANKQWTQGTSINTQWFSGGTTVVTPTELSKDTTQDLVIQIRGTLANATDNMMISEADLYLYINGN